MDFILRAWRRMTRDIARLPLWEVLQRRGTRPFAQGVGLEFAVERCSECAVAGRCARELAAGREPDLEIVCPNWMYIRHLDAMRRHAPKQDLL